MDTQSVQQPTEIQSTPSKPVLHLGFCDYYSTIDDFFIDVLSMGYEVIRDDENPDYVIFCDETFGTSHKKFNDKNVLKIFFTGENRRPWNYECHVAITFDHFESPRHYRLPLYVVENWVQMAKIGLPDIREIQRTATAADKTGFCSFVSSNPNCQDRNRAFELISCYKRIDSAGPLFNNMGYTLPRDGINAQKSKFDFLKTRKFNLCYENGSYPGYVTEKVFHALYTNTVPIYWGSSTVEMDFNPKAIINRHDYETDEELMMRIIELDNDDDKYNEVLQQPILNPRNKLFEMERFVRWFHNNVYHGQLNQR